MEARAQAEPSNEPRSFEFVLPKVDGTTFGETHSQDTHNTHNSGNTKGGGNDPRNTPLGSHRTTTQIQTTKEESAV